MRLHLPDVTLVAVNTVCHELTDLAVSDCVGHVKFGDIKIFTDRASPWVQIKPFANLKEAGEFTVYELPKYIKTSHALFIHWDSWVIDPGMWRDDFLRYDYIGAPWWFQDKYNVGNSGFCLRSKALLDFMASHREEFPIAMPEDNVLCRQYQLRLPQFKWAPERVAIDFSFERSRPSIDSRHFGFHGLFNWPFVLPPNRLAERMELVRNDPYAKNAVELKELDQLSNIWVKLWT